MQALLLRLAGPMQSWGTQSRFSVRDTDLEPSFSGVIGLLAAALGRRRGEPIDDLAALDMAVRVDRPGLRFADYHTAGGAHRPGERYGVHKANDAKPGTVVSRRWYLADADFLVALEGSPELLERLLGALARPVWPLFLGRRSCVPSVPLFSRDAMRPDSGPQALRREPWASRYEGEASPDRLRVVVTASAQESLEQRHDVPLTFDPFGRTYSTRYVRTEWIDVPGVI